MQGDGHHPVGRVAAAEPGKPLVRRWATAAALRGIELHQRRGMRARFRRAPTGLSRERDAHSQEQKGDSHAA